MYCLLQYINIANMDMNHNSPDPEEHIICKMLSSKTETGGKSAVSINGDESGAETEKNMSTTQPIKKPDDIERLKQYFYRNGELRNYALITLGVNTALRISDLLRLKWQDVWNFNTYSFREHVIITEQKTGKVANIYLNTSCRTCLKELQQSLPDGVIPSGYIFRSRTGNNRPISRNRAYVIIKKACRSLGYEDNISCHSLRKTFGYHAWKQGIYPTVIMSIYNHSSMEITKRYLSIEQDDKDEVFKNIML